MRIDLNKMKQRNSNNNSSLIELNSTSIEARIKEEMSLIDENELLASRTELELIYFFDSSLSVEGTEKIMADKFYSQVTKLRTRKEITVSLIIFDEEDHVLHYRQNGKDIKHTTYRIGFGTALYNTITKHLLQIKSDQEKSGTEKRKTIVTIMTDGGNNRNKGYGLYDLREAINDCKKIGWEFIFIAADELAGKTIDLLNLTENNAVIYDYRESIAKVFSATEIAIEEYAEKGVLTEDWKKELTLSKGWKK